MEQKFINFRRGKKEKENLLVGQEKCEKRVGVIELILVSSPLAWGGVRAIPGPKENCQKTRRGKKMENAVIWLRRETKGANNEIFAERG